MAPVERSAITVAGHCRAVLQQRTDRRLERIDRLRPARPLVVRFRRPHGYPHRFAGNPELADGSPTAAPGRSQCSPEGQFPHQQASGHRGVKERSPPPPGGGPGKQQHRKPVQQVDQSSTTDGGAPTPNLRARLDKVPDTEHAYHRHPERVVRDAEEPQHTGRDTYEQGGPPGSYKDQPCQLMREHRSRMVDVSSLGGPVRFGGVHRVSVLCCRHVGGG